MRGNWANIALSRLGEKLWNYLLIGEKKKDIFLINRAGISSGDELLVLQLSHDCLWLQHVSVPGSHCSPGHGCQLEMAVPWAGGCRLGLTQQHRGAFLSFLPPVLLQKHKSTLKKKKKKKAEHICASSFNHRQMFIWASNGFGFLFLSYLTSS